MIVNSVLKLLNCVWWPMFKRLWDLWIGNDAIITLQLLTFDHKNYNFSEQWCLREVAGFKCLYFSEEY